ncbi:MAG: hypothetical protein WC942_11530 [Clostridia bacterium]|jgi:hypothetical protein
MPIIGWFLINWGIGLVCGIIYFLFSGLKYVKYVREKSKETGSFYRYSTPLLDESIKSFLIFTILGFFAIFALFDSFAQNKRIIEKE